MRRTLARAIGGGLAVALAAGCGPRDPAERSYAAQVRSVRAAKDTVFAGARGPLTPEQRQAFKGLSYFPARVRWVVTARWVPAAQPEPVMFPTSQGSFDPYLRVGTLRFDLDGRPQTLALFRSAGDGHWFLPFADATSGRSTYGAGRYLEVEPAADSTVVLDFNAAYNPYCAYNAHWICPLAPPENRLDTAIEAGEKKFHDAP